MTFQEIYGLYDEDRLINLVFRPSPRPQWLYPGSCRTVNKYRRLLMQQSSRNAVWFYDIVNERSYARHLPSEMNSTAAVTHV